MMALSGTRESALTYPKIAFLVIAALAASAPRANTPQAPEPTPTSTAQTSTAPLSGAALTTGSSSESDEAAALIAKANAAAAANANARAATTAGNRSLTKVEASPEARKKAREFGFHAEVYNGTTLFCRSDAAIGSRIPLMRCMSAYEFDDYAVQLKIARDLMGNKNQCQAGKTAMSPCGGIQ
jgi:hypothetical protein